MNVPVMCPPCLPFVSIEACFVKRPTMPELHAQGDFAHVPNPAVQSMGTRGGELVAT
jgi:hypothetical protein